MRKPSAIHDIVRKTPAPGAPREPRAIQLHGHWHGDEFAYIRDPEDPRTRQYLYEENEYCRSCFDAVSGLYELLYAEIRQRIIEDDVSVPEVIGGYRYYTRVESGRQYPIHCRSPEPDDGDEEVYLDENRIAGDGRYCDVSVVSLCPRQKTVAFSVDRSGDECYEVFVGGIGDGEPACCVHAAGSSIAWSRDGRQLLYTGLDHNARPDSVWVYDLSDRSHRRIHVEPDPAFHVTVWLSRSGEWVFIDSAGNTSSETLVMPAGGALDEPTVLIPRRDDVEYMVDHHDDRFLVLTNDTAETFRLVVMPAASTGTAAPVELIAPDDRVTLEFVDTYRGHWVLGELRDGVRYTIVYDPATGSRHYLPGASALTHIDVEDLYDYDAGYVRFELTTPITPHTTYDLDVKSGESRWRKTTSPPGYDENDYVVERMEVPVDGVRVPLTLIRRRDLPTPGPETPLLLTGYGAYEESADMQFDSDLVSLLNRGVVAASAQVRGGGDLGPGWHDAGRLARKENSFRDFLACAHYLIECGYTGPGRIAAWGASAGGLLVAVAAQREPGLFASVVLEVPFVDVINTLLDPGLPLTEHDFDEFGNPAVAEDYQWIRAYCPYDNIRHQAYPPMLVTGAMNDQRVGYWEALKWAARLRSMRSDDNPLLVKIDDTGHLGESGRYEAAKESAIIYTFLLDMWGLTADAK